jgi:glucokinase
MPQDHPFIQLSQAKSPFFVGIDLSSTRLQAAIVDDAGQMLAKVSCPIQTAKNPNEVLRQAEEAAAQAIAKAGLQSSAIARVGLGLPSIVDAVSGTLGEVEGLSPDWVGFPICERFGSCLGLPVHIAHDTMAAAFGESWVGAGCNLPSLLLFHMGERVSCGVVYGEPSIDGLSNYGVESCHMIINMADDASLCTCGQRGHLAAYVSASALAACVQQAIERGEQSTLAEQLRQGQALKPERVAQAAEAGDAVALAAIAETARHLGVGIVNQMNTLDPDGFLLSGSMTFGGKDSPLGRQFMQWVKEEVSRRAFAALVEHMVIEYASLGENAVCIGAAGLARLDGKRNPQ